MFYTSFFVEKELLLWGPVRTMTDEVPDSTTLFRRLVGYYADCLAAQTQWGRAINAVDQNDVELLPLSSEEQRRFGKTGQLVLTDRDSLGSVSYTHLRAHET